MFDTKRSLTLTTESWPLAREFNISRGSKITADVLRVDICENTLTGSGECVPYKRYGETLETVKAQIETIRKDIETGLTPHELTSKLEPGAARNAVDCALWDLNTKISGMSAWQKAGITPSPKILTAFTISLDSPHNMALRAQEAKDYPLLKLKLGADDGLDATRINAIRDACQSKRLIIDANEGWDEANIDVLLDVCAQAHIELVEQPLPAKSDDILGDIPHPVAICADESVHTCEGLQDLRPKYDWINIKLDKTGGLTAGLKMLEMAKTLDFGIMVGCMVGTSLAMAPALILANNADLTDLDGPLWLTKDRENGLKYINGEISTETHSLWGETSK